MDINNKLYLPDYYEDSSGRLYYIYPTGQIEEVPPEYTEIHSQYSTEGTGHNYSYLINAYWDKRNPLVKQKCDSCGNEVVRLVISNGQNIFVCSCKTLKFGNKIE